MSREWIRHLAISDSALVVLGIDGMQRLSRDLTVGDRSIVAS